MDTKEQSFQNLISSMDALAGISKQEFDMFCKTLEKEENAPPLPVFVQAVLFSAINNRGIQLGKVPPKQNIESNNDDDLTAFNG